MGMPRQMIVDHARGIAETSGPDEANVAMVEMEGVRLVRGRIPTQVRRALNAAVKTGRLGHLRRDGLAPEAYYHRNARARALELREAEAKRGVGAISAVLVPHRPIVLDEP